MTALPMGKLFIYTLCAIIAILAVTVAHTSTQNDGIFPTVGQRRSVNRLLGPLASIRYQFSHPVKRTLDENDVSSVLFQDHRHLQMPFRTQFLLSQQRREEMVNRLFFRNVVQRDENDTNITPEPFLNKFILPSMLNTTDQGNKVFSAQDHAVIELLQELQQTVFEQMLQKDENLQKRTQDDENTTLNAINSSFDNLGDHQPDALSDYERDVLMNDYKQHLFSMFSVANLNENDFISSDLGSTTPFYTNAGLDELHVQSSWMPIFLTKVPEYYTRNAALSKFFTTQKSQNEGKDQANEEIFVTSIEKLNDYIQSVLLVKFSRQVEQSRALLAKALVDTGSTAYITTPELYNMWLKLLSPLVSIYDLEQKGIGITMERGCSQMMEKSESKVEYVFSIQTLLTQQQDKIIKSQQSKLSTESGGDVLLAYHPYYLWESYSLPITQPTPRDHALFHKKQVLSLSTLKSGQKKHLGVSDSTQLMGDDGSTDFAMMKFYEEFLNVEFGFEDVIDNVNNVEKNLQNDKNGSKMNCQATSTQQQDVESLFNLFVSTIQTPDATNTNVQSQQKYDLDNKIKTILPKLSANVFFTHPFYKKTHQEELLMQNIDISGVVNANLHQSFLMSIKFGQYLDELTEVVHGYMINNAEKMGLFSQNVETMTPTLLQSQFSQFILDTVIPSYLGNIINKVSVNIIKPDFLTSVIEDNFDLFLTPSQQENVFNTEQDLNYNLNDHHWLFQSLSRVYHDSGIHNSQVMVKKSQNESKLNQFLLSLSQRRYLQQKKASLSSSTTGNNVLYSYQPRDNTIGIGLISHFNNLFLSSSSSLKSSQTTINNDILTQFTAEEQEVNDICSECQDVEAIAFNKARADFIVGLHNITEWVCTDIWPAIAKYFGTNMCDPTVPGECYALCSGMVDVYTDSVADIIAFLNHDPSRTCFKQGKCTTDPDSITPAYPTQQLQSEGGDPNQLRQIFHLTDVHYDHLYSTDPDSRSRCHMPVCCSKTETKLEEKYGGLNGALFELALQHEYSTTTTPSGHFNLKSPRNEVPRKYGEYLCDSPAILVQSSVEQILLYCADFGVFTGDAPAHDLWRQNQKANMDAVQYVTESIQGHLSTCKKMFDLRQKLYEMESLHDDGKKNQNNGKFNQKFSMMQFIDQSNELQYRFAVLYDALPQEDKDLMRSQDKLRDRNFIPKFYPSIGNHLYSPVNHFAGFGGFDDWFLQPLAKLWGSFLPPTAVATTRFGGFYVDNAGPNTWIISLHTGLLDEHNPWRLLNLGHWDVSGQGHFLNNILMQIAILKGKAILIMHEPLGDLINQQAYQYYYSIYRKYSNTIINVLAGHEHHDYSKLIHVDYPVNMTNPNYLLNQLHTQQLQTPYYNNPILKNLPLVGTDSNDVLGKAFYLRQQKQNSFGRRTHSRYSNNNNEINEPSNLRKLVPMVLELLPSSITPMNYESNPSYRVIDVQNYSFVDYRQYIFDISQQDTLAPSAQWVMKYSASKLYGISPINAATWHQLILSKEKDDVFFEGVTLRFWGYIPDQYDPEFQSPRWTPLEALCATYTYSEVEMKYCVQHWNDQ